VVRIRDGKIKQQKSQVKAEETNCSNQSEPQKRNSAVERETREDAWKADVAKKK